MKQITFDASRYTTQKTGAKDKRAALLEDFLKRLNPPREQQGLKPIAPARLGKMLSHLTYTDLHAFYKICDQYDGAFGKAFWGALKSK